MKNYLTPKEVAAQLHISLASINYYTNIGLLRPEERKGNMRLYDKGRVLERWAKIRELRRQGYSLRVISRQLSE
jgi:DNA-binding transcriptional MerR regulator